LTCQFQQPKIHRSAIGQIISRNRIEHEKGRQELMTRITQTCLLALLVSGIVCAQQVAPWHDPSPHTVQFVKVAGVVLGFLRSPADKITTIAEPAP
jgi:hypothetical protein